MPLYVCCHIAYPFGFFVMSFVYHILVTNRYFFCIRALFLCHCLPLVHRIFFHCFGIFCFVCIFFPFIDISLIFILLPARSGLFPRIVLLFFCVGFCFLFLHVLGSFFCLIILACFRTFFFICVSSRISHSGFDFFYVIFKGIPIFSQINFLPA